MKAKIKWTLKFDYPLPEGVDIDLIKFCLEESHCQENLLDYLVSESEEGVCKLCSFGEVEVLEIIKK